MGKKRLLDASGDTWSTFEYDDATDTTIIGTFQDPTAIIENNKKMQGMGRGQSPELGLRPMASIPCGLASQWIREAGLNEAEFWKWPTRARNEFFRKRYMDSDYRHIRTSTWR